MTVQEWLSALAPDSLTADGYDDAIIGLAHVFGRGTPVVAYDIGRMIEICAGRGMDREDARDFLEFNVFYTWMGENTPVYIDPAPDD